MSLGSEYATERIISEEMFYLKIANEAETETWTTKSGEKIKIEDMSTGHLKNTIRFLQSSEPYPDVYLPWIVRMENELKRREG